ncbi:transglutaminase domain-containing protein [Flagellimonas sp. S3867]|uniref:transglutaminase domain-containing protein n=1 Tax=Flagellimonas sp. S3867 TaxID=2768063 RepID=UPI0016826EB7|nr:transglutaminase domain-containing protein [Flagellimonas sp. S3867]
MIKKIVVSALLLLIFTPSVAQEIKFGQIEKAELEETEYVNDESASAVILYKHRNTYLLSNNGVSRLVTEIHEKIKIYRNDGFDYATEEINLFKSGNDDEQVKKIKAVTYNLENGKIIESELQKEEIFKTEASPNYNQVKFTMPNVKVGSIVEFTYKVTSPFIWNIDEFRFQYDIPVKWMKAEIRTPKGFRFKQTPKGFQNVYPKTYTKQDNRIGMEVVVREYNIHNMPALQQESYVDNIDNYRSGVVFELVSVDFPGYFRSYSRTWGDVAKVIGGSDDYKNQLDRTRSFDDEIDALLEGKESQEDKMKAIFKYVKDNITWNGVDGKYFYHGIKKTLSEKKGNSADINLLVVAMLRYAGIDSNPVVISTKDNLIPFFPTINRLNYVLAYAVIDEKQYFMDATEEFSDLNVLPTRDYNWKGILIDNNKKVWKQIDIASPGKSTSFYVMDINLQDDGSCEGTCKTRFNRHSAMSFRKKYNGQDVDTYLTSKENKLSNIEIDNYTVKNADSHEGNVSESFDFFDDYGADAIDGKLFLKPLGFLSMKENPFKKEKREYPVDFGYSFKDTYMVNINIPEGYKVEHAPESVVVSLPEKLGTFRYIVAQAPEKVSVRVNFEINREMIASDSYPFLREFFKQIIAKESEQLILSKI